MTIDVVILTYGEPQNPSFSEQWSYSNRILYKLTRRVAPIPKFVVPIIGALRGRQRVKDWKEAHFRSPLEPITLRQTEAIQQKLQQLESNVTWRIHTAYEFRDPSFEALLPKLQQLGCEQLIIVPMYLPYSAFTAEISKLDYDRFQEKNNHPLPRVKYIVFRPCMKELTDIMAQHIRKEIEKAGIKQEDLNRYGLLLGVHGTVMSPPAGIKDTGYKDSLTAYQYLEEQFKYDFKSVSIGWLNHRIGGEWTSPTLEDATKKMQEQGIQDFIYFPYGFVADNAETKLEGKAVLNDLGIENYLHIECVNDDPAFIELLSKRIIRSASYKEKQAA